MLLERRQGCRNCQVPHEEEEEGEEEEDDDDDVEIDISIYEISDYEILLLQLRLMY